MKPKFIISGGGTGGHIFPAVAIADELRRRYPEAEFLFIGALGRMEMEKVPEAGYRIIGLKISGLQRSLSLKNLSFPFKVIASMLKARKLLKQFKPDAVIGTGGYASGPTLRAAASLGFPTLILEQNSYAGVTNKLLGRKVDTICVAFEGMERFFPAERIVITGNPVRQQIVRSGNQRNEENYRFFSLDPARRTLLLVGGSLGARTINESFYSHLPELAAAGIQVLWQTGKSGFDQAKALADASGYPGVKVFSFIREMDKAYAVADLVVSRAGAIAISELCLLGKPAILVPSPNVAEDHQTRNAEALVKKSAAVLIRDTEAREILAESCIRLLDNPEQLRELAGNSKQLAKPDAVSAIANCVEQIMKQ